MVGELTRPQQIAMRAVEDGRVYEEDIYEAGVSHRGVRRVANALEAKGLLRAIRWWDEEVGYEYEVTPAGRAWLAENCADESEESETR